MPRTVCEPLGVAEVAIYLNVKIGTVHQWLWRTQAKVTPTPLPPPDWTVNGQEAWNKTTIVGWAIASGKLDPENVAVRDAAWEKAKADGWLTTRRQGGEPVSKRMKNTGPATARPAPAKKTARKRKPPSA